MRILLTGATGFVGRHLVRALTREHEIHVISRRATAMANEIVADLRDEIDPALLPSNIDVVIHAAAAVGADYAPDVTVQTNATGTLHVVNAAVAMRARRLVYLSTGAVYASSPTPQTEDAAIEPAGDYAHSKWLGEHTVRAIRSVMRVQILRIFFPYGPGQSESRLIPRLVQRIRNGDAVSAASGDGPRLNPIYVDDLIEWIRRLLLIEDDVLVNLAGVETVSIRELAEKIGRIVRVAPVITTTPEAPLSWVGDISRAVRLTGYTPRVSIDDGLLRAMSSDLA